MNFSDRLRAVAIAAALVAPVAQAGDLGVLGPTYPVIEPDAIAQILGKLKAKEASGELARIKDEAIRKAVTRAKNPAPVEGLTIARERSSRLVDPTVHYDRAVTDEDGRVIVPAGSSINPLKLMGLSKRLVFFDGRDFAQTTAVRKMVQADGQRVKPILVAGSWFDTTKAWGSQVFFDQHGTLAKRFRLRAVPTVISQQGDKLLIEEVPAAELR